MKETDEGKAQDIFFLFYFFLIKRIKPLTSGIRATFPRVAEL